MCGYVGFTGGIYEAVDKKAVLGSMLEKLAHRGPDGSGTYCDEKIALGFCRLAIIDLSSDGDQPMLNEDGTVVVVFNGEIYNHKELRDELIKLGHRFKSRADTEVLVHGYEEYGEELLNKLRGMFSFAVWDKNKEQLLLARDIFGIKPLYYTKLKDGGLLFGSEIKSFLSHPLFEKRLNTRALKPFLTFQYNPLPETFFEGVFKLLPGHYITLKNQKLSIQRYHNYLLTAEAKREKTAARELEKVMQDSVGLHKLADTECGAFLSGGVDSSYIAYEMKPEKAFSVGFSNVNFDETGFAREFAGHINASIFTKYVEPNDCFENFAKMQYHLDEPDANPSVVPLYFLAQLAAQQVKVVVSGEGADELFGGYEAYVVSSKIKIYRAVLPRFLRVAIAKFAQKALKGNIKMSLIRGAKTEDEDFIGHAYIFTEWESSMLLNPKYDYEFSTKDITGKFYAEVEGKDALTRKIYLDLNLWLPGDILLKADKMSMAHSLELRVPFLDKEVFKFASSVPSSLKLKKGQTKYILRKAAEAVIPELWAKRPKKGFPVPIAVWLKDKKYYSKVKSVFVSKDSAEFFDSAKIVKLLNDHYEGRANNARKVWAIYTFLVWYEEFFAKR